LDCDHVFLASTRGDYTKYYGIMLGTCISY
jgi:hypothetical protein